MTVAQSLDSVVIFRRQSTTQNEFNEQVGSWIPYLTVRALRSDVSDGERFAAGSEGSYLLARFTLRSTQNTRRISPSDQMVQNGREWNIKGIKEKDEGRRRFLEITAATDAD